MKVIGTFDPKELYHQQKTTKKNSDFAAVLAFNLDKQPGEDDVTALFASNGPELEKLYEQTTGKKLNDSYEERTVAFAFWGKRTANDYRVSEYLGIDRNEKLEEFLIPVN